VSDLRDVLFSISFASLFAATVIGIAFVVYWIQTGLTLDGGWVRLAEFISLLVVVAGGAFLIVWAREGR
jgi:flagellar motor component MotA